MSKSVRLTSLLGFLVVSLTACGGSSGSEKPPADETPFPAPGVSSPVTYADAREKWGEPCVRDAIAPSPFTERWTYGVKPCSSGWCPAACEKGNGRIYLTFVDFVLTDVSEVEPQPSSPTVSVAASIANRSQSQRTCSIVASWLGADGQPSSKALLPETLVASGAVYKDAVSLPVGTKVSVFMTCHAPGQSSVESASATADVSLKRTCQVDGTYVYDAGGVPALSIATDC